MGDEPGEAPQDRTDQNWLHRQIQRVKGIRRRDVVIAQVGEGARNIVIGTRNIQVNVNDRNLTVPVLMVPLLLLVAVGFLAYPFLESMIAPILYPAQMTGPFRIAVAQFGEIGADGQVRTGPDGSLLSEWLYDGLKDELIQNPDVPLASQIEVWHDSDTETPQNFKFGIMGGDTPEARRQAAAKLADKIAAHMVIYGNLITDPGGMGLDLEFYLSPLVNEETAALVGSHRLGKLVPIPVPFDPGDPLANISVTEKLNVRADALFWLTVGLTQQLQGRSEQALATFRRAEEELVDWPEDDGKEILYFFIGREQFFLGQLDDAEASFREALRINPDYARATVALGSVYQKRAAEADTQDREVEGAFLAQAIEHQRRGLELAADTGDDLLLAIAHIALAKSYRLSGESSALLNELDEAHQQYRTAIGEADQAITLLMDSRQHRLLAQAYETQGAAYLQDGLVLNAQDDRNEGQASLVLAKAAYEQCIEQGDKLKYSDEILSQEVIGQGCQPLLNKTVEILEGLEGEG